MTRFSLRVWMALGACLLTAAGCQTTTNSNLPGELPARDTALQPKLGASTYFAHGHLLERQGELERALEQYSSALAIQPSFLTARNRLGITLNKLGRHHEASAQFRQAIADHPEQAYLYNNLGFSLYLEQEYAEAEQVLGRALALKPDFARARMNHALALARIDKLDEAFSELRKACSDADAYYNLALLQSEAGLFGEAAKSLETALQHNPELDAARVQLKEVARLAAEHANDEAPAVTTTDETPPTVTADVAFSEDADDTQVKMVYADAIHSATADAVMLSSDLQIGPGLPPEFGIATPRFLPYGAVDPFFVVQTAADMIDTFVNESGILDQWLCVWNTEIPGR